MIKRGMSQFFVEFFFLAAPKTLQVNPSVLCFSNFPLVNSFMDKKGEYQEFPSKCFCLTVPKNYAGEPFCDVIQKNPGGEKVYGKEAGGSIKIFCRKILCNSAAKKW